ncbi:uncharacterized protein LOC116778779 [Danaus plexippus]|uniref:uncharacterized protein LOC116778779 n=1 Tax=Danaus plexippus TaxID=13037 RepID=UPI002AAF9256|nr:uncharacterized protein LOC116778779 [Danaus plexippus]XP_032528694.2 uncharacterized protein LOC116778779 [Danaus plexippus]
MQFLRLFFTRITDDLKQKKLVPLKILFFMHASTLFVLYPYLTIHMRELGINVEETAIMSAVTPVVSIMMPPLAGMLADKIGNFRLLLALSSLLGGASALLLLAVPVGRITVTFPPQVDLLLSCDGGNLALEQVRDYPCQPLHPYAYDVNLTVLSCGFVCELPHGISSEDINSVVRANSYDVNLKSQNESQRLLYRNTVSSLLSQTGRPVIDHSNSRIMTNDVFFNSTPTNITKDRVFFPTPKLYGIDCTYDENNASCSFGKEDFFKVSETDGIKETSYKVRISHDIKEKPIEVRNYLVNAIILQNATEMEDYGGVDTTTCKDNFAQILNGDSAYVKAASQRMSKCSVACAARTPRTSLCDNVQQKLELDPTFTFWAYLAVRVFIGIIGGTSFAMFEGAVIAIVRDQKADYGLQRVYGSLGGMIFSPLSGLLIDYASRGKGYTDFRPAFYLYAVLKVLSGGLMMSIDLQFKQPAQNLLADVISVFRNIELVVLFIVCFVMGTAWGYIESFLFWLLQDLGASRSLMGVTITVGGVAGLPLLVLSGPIINKLGHANVLFIGFVFYAIRLLGYSLIYNPWLCLIFEALESVTSSLSFTAAVTYAARLSSTTTDTSVQGLLGGLYYGVGKGAGSLIGGYLMKFVGTRPTYQLFAIGTLVTGCFYYLFNRFYIRKRSRCDGDICKKKTETLDIENRDGANKEPEKHNSLDVDTRNEMTKNMAIGATLNLKTEVTPVSFNTDGASDVGFDNHAFNDDEKKKLAANDKKDSV